MKINETPRMELNAGGTGCCPAFNPTPWDNKEFIFKDKPFVKAATVAFLHIPLNMGSVMKKTWKKMEEAGIAPKDSYFMLSHDPSPWKGEHYMAVTKESSDPQTMKMSGTFLTKVFEGPYKEVGKWAKEMEAYVAKKGKKTEKLFFFYTTCPKCYKHYGKNYIVAFAKVA